MGRTGSGVEIREKSIRLEFTLDGRRERHTLRINGEPMPPTPANVKYANRLAIEIRDRIRHGTFSLAEYFPAAGTGASPTSVETQLESWIGGQRIEESTRKGYSSAIAFWNGTIGDKSLRALKTSHILAALNTRANLSGKTINNYVSVLREALELAVIDKLMPANPVVHVPRASHQKPEIDPFSREEAESIIDGMVKWHPKVAGYTAFKFFTGLRTSESFGLRWPNVDLASGHILVSEGVVDGIETKRTKTNIARRVTLNSRSRAALVSAKEDSFLAGQHVFLDPRHGARWADDQAFRKGYWEPVLKRLGIRYRPPYNTRHTYATMMLMAGMTPAFCAAQMGHSVEIFLGTYAKWIPGAGDTAEMKKLEAALDSPLESPREKQNAPDHGA